MSEVIINDIVFGWYCYLCHYFCFYNFIPFFKIPSPSISFGMNAFSVSTMVLSIRWRMFSRCLSVRNGSINHSFLFRNNLVDTFQLHQRTLCLFDDSIASSRRCDRLVGTLEDAHIEFLLQFLHHRTQRWLRDITCLGRPCKVAEAVEYAPCTRSVDDGKYDTDDES